MTIRFAPTTTDLAQATPIYCLKLQDFETFMQSRPAALVEQVRRLHFQPKLGSYLILHRLGGGFEVVFIQPKTREAFSSFAIGGLVDVLPPGLYHFEQEPENCAQASLAWLLNSYRFRRYKTSDRPLPQLLASKQIDAAQIEMIAQAVAFGRDLINTPANDMGPAQLEAATVKLAEDFSAKVKIIGEADLLEQNFPLIHAVGKGAEHGPRLVSFIWGREDAPKVTLIGKGVCFDTGGLDIKPSSNMILMKKDMGGAATALTLARMIMSAKLDLRLHVILPIVENSVSARAMRPSDVYSSRKGLSVEIGNTDAEGRLILADALSFADDEAPDYLFDFATLTGAARVALGPDLPPFFTQDDAFAAQLSEVALRNEDPLWRLPLWQPYEASLNSKIADLNNAGSGAFAGSISAALFLQTFVTQARHWVHLDIYGWTPQSKPARPEGGEPQAARAVFAFLKEKFARKQ